jgi:hypothetical protein
VSYTPQVPTRTPAGWSYLGTPIGDRSAQMLIDQAHRFTSRMVGPYLCWCGCGRLVTNWGQECYPRPWWDTPGLPPRRPHERCANHGHCAYRDDDPYRCPTCHTIPERCTCRHHQRAPI